MPDIPSGIIDFVLNPPLGSLKRGAAFALGPGPVDGSLPVPTPLGTTAYGAEVSIFTIPAPWGKKLGNPNVYNPAFMQLALEVTLSDGNTVTVEEEFVSIDGHLKRWAGGFPTNLLYHVEPGVTVIVRWLVVF